MVQDTGKSIADSFLFFLFYNYIRTNRLQKHGPKATTLPALEELVVGTIAGACSKAFTAPISNIVTRKQTASMLAARSDTPSSEPSVADIINTIRSEKGIQGFWSGYSASLVLTLNPSITFFLHEFFKRALLPRAQRDDPGARITFFMAAFSKAIASSVTYPFSLAKARAQTSSKPPVDPASAKKVKDEVKHIDNEKDVKQAGHGVKTFAKQSTVFNTVMQIYRTEGAAGLYEGLGGEILKGFFSHGMTMLIKESVHKFIIQAYYLILKALDKYPSPGQLATQAGTVIQDAGEKVQDLAQEGYKNVSEQAGNAGEMLQEGYKSVSGQAIVVADNSKELVGNAIKDGKEAVSGAIESGKDAIGVGTEKAAVVGSNAKESTINASDVHTQGAGHLMGNAQEMLGGKIEEVGQGIKPAKSE